MKTATPNQKATTSNKSATTNKSTRSTATTALSTIYTCNSYSANVQSSSYTWAKKIGRQFKLAAISTTLCYNF